MIVRHKEEFRQEPISPCRAEMMRKFKMMALAFTGLSLTRARMERWSY